MKKKLTEAQEFDVMKLVLDKFLWLGFAIMAFGLWKMVKTTFIEGFTWIAVGAIVLIIFLVIIVKEYEIMK